MRGILARPELPPKTPLASRLRAVRKALGDPDRSVLADKLGIAPASLANYERGDRVPDASVLLAYREHLGVDVNWLIADAGEIFADPEKAPSEKVRPNLLEKLALLAKDVHREQGLQLPDHRITNEAGQLYNQLISMVPDLGDYEMIEAKLPELRLNLKRRLQEAIAKPGTGKRSAS